MQHDVMHRWTFTNSVPDTVPGLQRHRHSARKTRVNALMVLRRARETLRQKHIATLSRAAVLPLTLH